MEKGNKIILVLGLLAIAAGILLKYEAASFQKKAVLTEGKVIHVNGSSYKIQYSTADGIEKIYWGSGKSHGYHEGDIVKVWYKSSNPDRVRFSDRKKESRTVIIVGLACILLGIYPLFMKKKDHLAS